MVCEKKIGTKDEVYDGIAQMTAGRKVKRDLMLNKSDKVVFKSRSDAAKQAGSINNLIPYMYCKTSPRKSSPRKSSRRKSSRRKSSRRRSSPKKKSPKKKSPKKMSSRRKSSRRKSSRRKCKRVTSYLYN